MLEILYGWNRKKWDGAIGIDMKFWGWGGIFKGNAESKISLILSPFLLTKQFNFKKHNSFGGYHFLCRFLAPNQ